ncbi:MAG: pantetheine-phosphate adenylyltransferase [Candidatus Burarchaeum sp.]|nr:pantetheine-phosphate adenylyltransferase [Candidatus Burarchaeum sp.]MDO8339279.1 pantetheine-phosphate adenylyltransferase [Candidatus Burarchaeum sp.]
MARFKHVVVAGTFNCIHGGHRKLLRTAIETGEHVLLGLTSERFAREIKGVAKPFGARMKALEEELAKIGGAAKCKIVEIDDEIGMAGEKKELQAIVVSTETEPNARKVNEVRRRKGLQELQIIVIPLVNDVEGRKLSCRRLAGKTKL